MLKRSPHLSVILVILGLSTTGVSLLPDVANARSPLAFKMPKRGAPPITGGSASRSAPCIANRQPLQGLMPVNNFGFTTVAQPSLLVQVPPSSAQSIEVSVETQDGNQVLYTQTFAVPATPGIVRLNLNTGNHPPLALNQSYRWFVSLVCDADDRSNDATIEGWVQRIEPDAALRMQLARQPKANHPALYANAGIWYDTLAQLEDLRRQYPQDRTLTQDWTTLLKSVKLDAIAPVPLAIAH